MTDDGYRDLRSRLRTELQVDEISAARTMLTARLRGLQTTEAPVLARALAGVLSSVSDFAEAARSAAILSIERSVLIEMQIDRLDFVGRLHEDYHAVSRGFESQYHSVVQHGKRLANSLAHLVYELLPHEQRRGIRAGSFGRLYGSLSGMSEDREEPLSTARQLVMEHGAFLEAVVHEYRNDVIDHFDPRASLDTRARLTADDRLDILRADRDRQSDDHMGYTRDPNWPGFVYQDFWRLEGQPAEGISLSEQAQESLGYRYIVHAHANLDLEQGQAVGTDTPVAFLTDGGSGHFDRHGPHSHTFSSRDFPAHLAGEPETVYGMPGLAELAIRYASLTSDILDVVER